MDWEGQRFPYRKPARTEHYHWDGEAFQPVRVSDVTDNWCRRSGAADLRNDGIKICPRHKFAYADANAKCLDQARAR